MRYTVASIQKVRKGFLLTKVARNASPDDTIEKILPYRSGLLAFAAKLEANCFVMANIAIDPARNGAK